MGVWVSRPQQGQLTAEGQPAVERKGGFSLTALGITLYSTVGAPAAAAPPRTLVVTSHGAAEAQPDRGRVVLAIQCTRDSAKAARDEAAEAAAAVLVALAGVEGVAQERDVTTLDMSVQPQYTWDEAQRAQRITGYIFSQRLQVKIQDLTNERLAAVVDAAVSAGGDNLLVESIQAELSPEVALAAANRARAEAARSARAAAEVLAEASGVTLGAIKSLTDGAAAVPSPHPFPMPAAYGAGMAKEALATPVNVGPSSVTAAVTAEFFISG